MELCYRNVSDFEYVYTKIMRIRPEKSGLPAEIHFRYEELSILISLNLNLNCVLIYDFLDYNLVLQPKSSSNFICFNYFIYARMLWLSGWRFWLRIKKGKSYTGFSVFNTHPGILATQQLLRGIKVVFIN